MTSPAERNEAGNQSPAYENVDLFTSDRPLWDAVRANGGAAETSALTKFGRDWGAAGMFELGRQANENIPGLGADGQVAFHPAYHRLMSENMAAGLHASTWQADGSPAPAPAQVIRAARFYMAAQIETGHLCPLTMTRAAVAAFAAAPSLAAAWLPKVIARDYDPEFRPWPQKRSVTLGMGMTEKQGGTDVRANTTQATPTGEGYAVTGHKWFMSAPMCDAFLVLAQAAGGLTCFLMPRFKPDGSINALTFQRLKDKLGNRSNASSEVEFEDAFAWRVGGEGDGARTIIQMVQLTRLDCAVASAGLMRMALAQALHHARHRAVFGKHLAEQPMMRRVLADMALETEAAVALVMRLCRSFDLASHDAREAARARLLTPATKFLICKATPALAYEAMECLGGNGYVETSLLPRLYREAPVNAIWEGSGNVMCLDVLRVFAREGAAARDVLAVLAAETAEMPGARATATSIQTGLAVADAEASARITVERLGLLAAAAALRECAPPAIAEAFARTRLAKLHGGLFGTSDIGKDETTAILDRALPG
ncbi:MAG: acyl-CoA dehydrogenase family protein [Xanthobacteraceae bacterium]